MIYQCRKYNNNHIMGTYLNIMFPLVPFNSELSPQAFSREAESENSSLVVQGMVMKF